jgi:hypothetical protein
MWRFICKHFFHLNSPSYGPSLMPSNVSECLKWLNYLNGCKAHHWWWMTYLVRSRRSLKFRGFVPYICYLTIPHSYKSHCSSDALSSYPSPGETTVKIGMHSGSVARLWELKAVVSDEQRKGVNCVCLQQYVCNPPLHSLVWLGKICI